MAGETPGPLVVRAINRRTGEERWRIVKATAVPGRRLAVNVIEDVTEVKRAELAQRFLAEAGAVLAVLAGLRADAGADRRARRPAAGRLVRGHAPRRRPAAHRRRRARRSGQAPLRPRLPAALPDAARARRRARRRCCATASRSWSTASPTRSWSAAVPDPEQREAVSGLGMRAVMLVPMLAGGRAIGVISLVSAESGRRFTSAATSSWPRSSAGAPAPRSRTPASTASARTSPPRSSAGCCPDELPDDPGPAARVAVPAGGRGEPRRRRLLRRVRDRHRLDAAGRRRHRPRRGCGRADRAGAAHAAHGRTSCSAIRAPRSSSSTTR